MGNVACCSDAKDDKGATAMADELARAEAVPVVDDAKSGGLAGGKIAPKTYKVSLNKSNGTKLGLDVDFMAERVVLPIIAITGGLAEEWNKANPGAPLQRGDSILEVNGVRGDVATMLEKCKNDKVLNLTLVKALTYDFLIQDIEQLIKAKSCGPILVRLSWSDAGVFSKGKLTGGCPNAAMRHGAASGEGAFEANRGLPTVAIGLLAPVADKYCPDLISHADLWVVAANIAIRLMGGPDVPTRFGRADAKSPAEGVKSQDGRLPDGGKGADHLREIFNPKGFDDKGIVALSGAHSVGGCHSERTGFQGSWTEQPLVFNNAYFKDLLSKKWTKETLPSGKTQYYSGAGASKTIMLESDMALATDPSFKKYVEVYAANQDTFFADFLDAWVRIQESGCTSLRDIL
mmetsp:Transcript_58701/g.154630  ORF Transcript_58701/g.154630 Transcript_58701/m.154630 type:complete len:404 (-) Transcript_58701:174-1385(-)